MKILLKSIVILVIAVAFLSCKSRADSKETEAIQRTQIELVTTQGTVVLELYNETPLHRDNFIKLANQKAFDSLLFHRVIQNFMVQGGDPDSRAAKASDTLGDGDLPYTVPAEIISQTFHKKGALGAARDGNLARASSSMQFYIVQGKVHNDSLLEIAQNRINEWLAQHYFKNHPDAKPLLDAIDKAREQENTQLVKTLNDSIEVLAKAFDNFEKYTIPESHREVYKTIGGSPHLDQNYTVFGEVIKGLQVVDSIAAVPTGAYSRPLTDVRILSVRILN